MLPKQGVGLLYGASQTFKSFVATHMGLHVARAQPWAGRQTEALLRLAIHHTGWNEDAKDRPQGWSGLPAALDVMILSERKPATCTRQPQSRSRRTNCPASGSPHIWNELCLASAGQAGKSGSPHCGRGCRDRKRRLSANPAKSIPRSRRLIMDMVLAAIEEAGEDIRPFANGPIIRAVSDETVRRRYYARIAEQAPRMKTFAKWPNASAKEFNRAISDVLNAKDLMAQERDGRGSYGCHARDIF